MLATLGDLVDDIVARLDGPLQWASDTEARIHRRPGGSAANVAVAAAERGAPARFLGQVGADATGDALLGQLISLNVDMTAVRRGGSTGTVLVIVDESGERSMLTDRRACLELADPAPWWLDTVTVLHVPFYSLVTGPLRDTALQLIDWSHTRNIAVSIDVSSAALIEKMGSSRVRQLLSQLAPTAVLANEDEANSLGISSAVANALTIVKRGPRSAVVYRPGARVEEVPAIALDSVVDTTGAGDAFAAGFLTHDFSEGALGGWQRDPVAACHTGHRVAAELLRGRVPSR
ncbi:MAG: carbohydrate kinase family protein [Acidimicrobiales bacterium]